MATRRQFEKLEQFARQKGTSAKHVQKVLASGVLSVFFDPHAKVDDLKGKIPQVRAMVGLSTLVPRATKLLRGVSVNYGEWEDVVRQAGPNTPNDYNIWKVGGLYTSRHTGIVRCDITLVNFGQSVESPAVLQYGEENGMRTIDPWECFAVGRRFLKLNKTLKRDSVAVVSLEKCDFEGKRRVVYVWFDEDGREANLDWFDLRWFDNYWFGFVSEHK